MPRSILVPRLHPRESLGPEYLGVHGQIWAANTAPKVKKTSHACESCRSRRIKCDGRAPSCSACLHSQRRCEYSDLDRRRKGDKEVELDLLHEKIRGFEAIMACLKCGSNEEIGNLISSIREDPGVSDSESNKFDVLAIPDQHPKDQTSRWQAPSPKIFSPEHLPPEHVIRLGLATFYAGSFIFFYVLEEDEATALCDQVYRSDTPPTRMTLSELCALAAVGHIYDGDEVSVAMMEALYRTASSLSNECLDEKPLRVMRVLVSLSMYAFMTRKYSARLSVATGLQIARWARLDLSPELDGWVSWRKVYRTLVFLEWCELPALQEGQENADLNVLSWLAASLGYQFDLSQSEIEFTKSDILEPVPSFENAIQAQISMIGLLMAGVLQEVYGSSKSITFAVTGRCSETLNNWRRSLPPLMELSAITATETAEHVNKHRRSLFLIHAIYLGVRMLLYRPLLVAIARCNISGKWGLDGSVEMGRHLQSEAVDVAKTCVRLLNLLNSGSHWLCISHASAACSILLLDMAQSMLERNDGRAMEDLIVSQECIDILKERSTSSRIAQEMLDDIGSLHENMSALLRGEYAITRSATATELLQTGEYSKEPTGEPSRVDASKGDTATVIATIQQAIDLLGNPFHYERKFEFEDFEDD